MSSLKRWIVVIAGLSVDGLLDDDLAHVHRRRSSVERLGIEAGGIHQVVDVHRDLTGVAQDHFEAVGHDLIAARATSATQRLDGVGRDRLQRRAQRLAEVAGQLVLLSLGRPDVRHVDPDHHLAEHDVLRRRAPGVAIHSTSMGGGERRRKRAATGGGALGGAGDGVVQVTVSSKWSAALEQQIRKGHADAVAAQAEHRTGRLR